MSALSSFAGTKIVYERTFLMNLRNSPLSHTPPKNIPCHLMKNDNSSFHHHSHQNQMNGTYHPPQNKNNTQQKEKDKSNGWSKVRKSADAEEHQFDMDI
jgi:Eukaryotic translation initiation factor 4E binding protein (EIF4EBP)